jgi:EmrB/QacA subfamily drug resistance transporter
LCASFVATLDNFIVFVAIPSIRRDLGASFADAEFIVAAYTLTFAMGMITSGRLGDRYGRRRMFIIGFAAFTVASGLCGVAPSPGWLIFFRVVQGIAASVLSPQVLALLRVTFSDPRERAIAFAWMGATIGLAGVLGQVIGGFVVSADLFGLSWRPVFLINIPVGIVALVGAPLLLDESRASGTQRLDPAGTTLSALGLGLLLYPLIEGREAGWPVWSFLMLAAAGVVLCLFAAHQYIKTRRNDAPLLDTDLFRDRAFVVGLVSILLFYGTIAPFVLSFSYLLQLGFERSPIASALYFSPLAITFVFSSFAAGRLTRGGARRVLMAGALITMSGAALAYATSAFDRSLSPLDLMPSMVMLGLGQGFFMTPAVNAVLTGIPERHTGAASGVLTTMQRVGSALGVALLEIPFFAALKSVQATGVMSASAYATAFSSVMLWISIALAVVCLLVALLPSGRATQAEKIG